MRMLGKLAKILGIILLLIILMAAVLVSYLTITEYSPQEIESLVLTPAARQDVPAVGDKLTLVSFNIGYGGLGKAQDFFMDGGMMVRPEKEADVKNNMAGILSILALQDADLYLLQEVDRNSARSYYMDQEKYLRHGLSLTSAMADNYRCDFVPFPWPPIGKVESGLMTLTALRVAEATRESLPVPFSWPLRIANLKRCLLVERIPMQDTNKELVIVNLHLEAYDSGEGKRAQTEQLMGILRAEYRKGNYVIAGGDFNQNFPGMDLYPMLSEEYWTPGELSEQDLPQGFHYVMDGETPTCRSLHAPYTGNRNEWQFYVIDGFIVSPNVKVNGIETIDQNFQYSDHQPVKLEVTLMAE